MHTPSIARAWFPRLGTTVFVITQPNRQTSLWRDGRTGLHCYEVCLNPGTHQVVRYGRAEEAPVALRFAARERADEDPIFPGLELEEAP